MSKTNEEIRALHLVRHLLNQRVIRIHVDTPETVTGHDASSMDVGLRFENGAIVNIPIRGPFTAAFEEALRDKMPLILEDMKDRIQQRLLATQDDISRALEISTADDPEAMS